VLPGEIIMANKLRNETLFTLCQALAISIITLWAVSIVSGQTTVKSSSELRLRRIAEHQQIRRAALELTQDLRAIHLSPEQRQEIRQLLKRYHTNTGTDRRDSSNENAAQATPEGSGSVPPQVAERLRTEVAALLTSEQNESLNSIREEREERAKKNPDFQIRKKP
jgi:hypothetical protein